MRSDEIDSQHVVVNPYSAPRVADDSASITAKCCRRTRWHYYVVVHFAIVLMSVPLPYVDGAEQIAQVWKVLAGIVCCFCAMFAVVGPFASLCIAATSIRRRSSRLGYLAIADFGVSLLHYPILLPLVQ